MQATSFYLVIGAKRFTWDIIPENDYDAECKAVFQAIKEQISAHPRAMWFARAVMTDGREFPVSW